MTVTAHNARRTWGGATRKAAIGNVSAAQPKRRRGAGWLHCSVDEFMALLAEHEAGKINLLEIDADSPDSDIADQPEPEELEAVRGRSTNGSTFGCVLAVMQRATKPLCASQIANMSGVKLSTVKDYLTSGETFVLVQTTGFTGYWMLKSKVVKNEITTS